MIHARQVTKQLNIQEWQSGISVLLNARHTTTVYGYNIRSHFSDNYNSICDHIFSQTLLSSLTDQYTFGRHEWCVFITPPWHVWEPTQSKVCIECIIYIWFTTADMGGDFTNWRVDIHICWMAFGNPSTRTHYLSLKFHYMRPWCYHVCPLDKRIHIEPHHKVTRTESILGASTSGVTPWIIHWDDWTEDILRPQLYDILYCDVKEPGK